MSKQDDTLLYIKLKPRPPPNPYLLQCKNARIKPPGWVPPKCPNYRHLQDIKPVHRDITPNYWEILIGNQTMMTMDEFLDKYGSGSNANVKSDEKQDEEDITPLDEKPDEEDIAPLVSLPKKPHLDKPQDKKFQVYQRDIVNKYDRDQKRIKKMKRKLDIEENNALPDKKKRKLEHLHEITDFYPGTKAYQHYKWKLDNDID